MITTVSVLGAAMKVNYAINGLSVWICCAHWEIGVFYVFERHMYTKANKYTNTVECETAGM